ncbi:hypothetical protein EVAR_97741_1 [Eumeta japonica]|uniref:Uncharacterized protein n=1 Tax=Eumeta variegata TaxID=151549 RepID=A0A4C1XA78_EUMVA|nr:hypothetical protein EVAR_97741_1 [Eumeta japonica]
MPSDSGAAWTPPAGAGAGERRLSNSSDGSACSGYSKAHTNPPSLSVKFAMIFEILNFKSSKREIKILPDRIVVIQMVRECFDTRR